MLPDTLQRRLESIPTLSRQGKRINGLSRLLAEPLLWEQVYAEIASKELGLKSQGGASVSHELQEWLGRSRGLNIGM